MNCRDVLRKFAKRHLKRGASFLVVGGLSFIVDALVYNLLTYAGGRGPLFQEPLLAKTISVLVATLVSYIGSRLWTFNDSQRPASAWQFIQFILINVAAIGIQLGCLGFSRYVLHQANAFADNLSGTVIGQFLATLFRYFMYGKFVFPIK